LCMLMKDWNDETLADVEQGQTQGWSVRVSGSSKIAAPCTTEVFLAKDLHEGVQVSGTGGQPGNSAR
jgi:hypothetical protein